MKNGPDLPLESSSALALRARVVESFGRHTLVEMEDSQRQAATLFGKRLQAVCGDRVLLRQDAGSDAAQIVQVEPRSSFFSRTDSRGRIEALAANLTLVCVLAAPLPVPDFYMLDRYLAGAAFAGLRGALVFNKIDLLQGEELGENDKHPKLKVELAQYRQAGYAVFELSAEGNVGIDALRTMLAANTTLFAGQSGVGKTTLLNRLIPETGRLTRSLSTSTEEGKHTTVSAALFRMTGGGEIIDSPGVRDYAPAPVAESDIQVGWPEILRAAPGCRFNNCLHVREPSCAVLAAIASGEIAARRYESYRRLLNIMRGLGPEYERRR